MAKEKKDFLRKHQNCLSKNDWHDASVVDFEWHKRSPTRIYLSPDCTLGVLNWNLSLRLGNCNDTSNDGCQQENQRDKVCCVEIGRHAASGKKHIFERNRGLRQSSENADGDDK